MKRLLLFLSVLVAGAQTLPYPIIPDTQFRVFRTMLNADLTSLNNNTARTGQCRTGQVVVQTTTTGVVCLSIPALLGYTPLTASLDSTKVSKLRKLDDSGDAATCDAAGNCTFIGAVAGASFITSDSSFKAGGTCISEASAATPASGVLLFCDTNKSNHLALKDASGTVQDLQAAAVGGGLADPGSNGLVKRTGLNVTAAAVSGTDYEAPLGNPSTNGYVLSSTSVGVRSWIAPSGGSAPMRSFGYAFDGAGSSLTTGLTSVPLTVPAACTLHGWNLNVDQGTATIKVWKVATGTAIPTVANAINTSGVAIATGTARHSTVLTDFTTTAFAADDILVFSIASVSNATQLFIGLECQ